MTEEKKWDLIIRPKDKLFRLELSAVWKYRDLLMLLVRRDFVAIYKQTVLGPVWFVIQPLLTTLTFTVIFGSIAKISTDGIQPPFLFYLTGITLWSYFADCFNKTSNTFVANASVFGKVYFPRLVVPLSVLISNLLKLAVQFSLFLIFWTFYLIRYQNIHPDWNILWLLPLLVIIMAGLGLGFGILVSSLTTKYRDFTFLVGFGVQLMMYASPVVYPLSQLSPKWAHLILFNPVSSLIETFKVIFLGKGAFLHAGSFIGWAELAYSFSFMIVLLFIALTVFKSVEKTFMDTV
jgi:lipopolysaccharide transport system permease protein